MALRWDALALVLSSAALTLLNAILSHWKTVEEDSARRLVYQETYMKKWLEMDYPDVDSQAVYDQFSRMKQGVFIVNTARAGLMDEQALRATLRSGKLGGLALDVFHAEPIKRDDEYFNYPNVILTPHIAGAGRDVIYLQSVMLVNDLMLYLAGGHPRTIVDKAVFAHEGRN